MTSLPLPLENPVELPPLVPPGSGPKPHPPTPPSIVVTPLFKWDGSNIGAVDQHIASYRIISGRVYLYFKDGTVALANRYDNSVALICDELKPLFGLPKIGRHRCTIDNRQAIISHIACEAEHPFNTEMATPELITSLQRCYLFRWVLGLTQNSDAALWVRRYKSGVVIVTSYRENNVAYHKKSPAGAIIPDVSMKRWFTHWDQVNALTSQLFGSRNLSELRFEIDAIIRRVDPKQVSWIACIMQRIQERCMT